MRQSSEAQLFDYFSAPVSPFTEERRHAILNREFFHVSSPFDVSPTNAQPIFAPRVSTRVRVKLDTTVANDPR